MFIELAFKLDRTHQRGKIGGGVVQAGCTMAFYTLAHGTTAKWHNLRMSEVAMCHWLIESPRQLDLISPYLTCCVFGKEGFMDQLQVTRVATTAKKVAIALNVPCLAHPKKAGQ